MSAQCTKCGDMLPEGAYCKGLECPLREAALAAPCKPAETVGQHYEAGRQQGRAEALAILIQIEPECGIDEYIGWRNSGAPEDEGGAYWNEPKLRELFAVDGVLADMMDKAEGEYWRYKGLQDEAERGKNFAANMHSSGKVREVLAKAGEFDLMGQLCNTAPVPAAGVQGDSDRARIDWCVRTLETVKDGGREALGTAYPEIIAVIGALKRVQELDIEAPTAQPDSGRDAALSGKIVDLVYNEIGETERDKLIRKVANILAAHPAPSSDAAMRDVIALAWKWHREAVSQGFACSEPAQELFELLGWPDADAAHPANGAQAGLSDTQIDQIARNYFAEDYAQTQVKHAIHDAFLLAAAPQTKEG